MTDREMLELAAKAAGYALDNDTSTYGFTLGGFKWNPLTDDGDALRLAVKLQLDVINDGFVCVARTELRRNIGVIESLSSDPDAATRLAITRAAAEIGRSMK